MFTATGTDLLVVVPSPNIPYSLNPQQEACPSATAHVCAPRALMCVTVLPWSTPVVCTATGIDLLVVVPSPNFPE